MKRNYKKIWLRLRKQLNEDLKRADKMHTQLVNDFKWQGYGRDWDNMENILDWQHEKSHLECLLKMLDEIEAKKCHTVIMTDKQFSEWKNKVKLK